MIEWARRAVSLGVLDSLLKCDPLSLLPQPPRIDTWLPDPVQ